MLMVVAGFDTGRISLMQVGARLIASVALPEHKPTALTLLDRAAQLAPEDEETKALK